MTRVIYLKAGGGYDNIFMGNQDISDPMNDEAQIRLHASSLNYHDYAVVSGVWGRLSSVSRWQTAQARLLKLVEL